MASLWEPWRFSGAITAFTEPSPGWPLFVSRMEAKQYPICPGTRMVLSRNLAKGYLPMLVTLAVVPGLPSRFWEGIKFLFEYGATNIARLWPRPWWVQFDQLPWDIAAGEVLLGALFPALPAFGALGIGVLCARFFGRHATATPVFASAVFLAIPYSHYAWARADLRTSLWESFRS